MIRNRFVAKSRGTMFVEIDKAADTVYITAPYHEEFLRAFRGTIPQRDRKWNAELGAWVVRRYAKYAFLLQDLAVTFYEGQEESSWNPPPPLAAQPPQPMQIPTQITNVDQAIAALFALATPDELHTLYRTVMKRLHPDNERGSPEKASLLSAAWSYIKNPCQ